MHHGAVLGDANKKPVPKNIPVMHCQRRYSQVSSATSEWRIAQANFNFFLLSFMPGFYIITYIYI